MVKKTFNNIFSIMLPTKKLNKFWFYNSVFFSIPLCKFAFDQDYRINERTRD